uniref:Mediator of RNA polymerase II transcription subunit 22 n=1 Tax=Culex pipiens TaxID=7175 RepID=A0A8D8CYL0_CULPI
MQRNITQSKEALLKSYNTRLKKDVCSMLENFEEIVRRNATLQNDPVRAGHVRDAGSRRRIADEAGVGHQAVLDLEQFPFGEPSAAVRSSIGAPRWTATTR